MSTKPPEPSPEQIAQWWDEARDVHADNPGLAPMQLARLAYAAGWKARAAEPVAGEPSDEELLEIRDGAYCPSNDEINDEDDSSWQYTSDYIRWLDEDGTPQEQEAYAAKGLRAVFEAGRRWDRPAPHAEGEVGELVGKLGWIAAQCADIGWPDDSITVTRAADLLERQAAPVPVAVSERPWEREGWSLDPDGECWWCPFDGPPYWELANPARVYGGWVLPAGAIPIPYSALPLPSGEAANG